jgi:hypothetical protein
VRDLAEVVRGDGSDAIKRLGGIDSPLADSLKWARKVSHAFGNGLKETIATLRRLASALSALSNSGVSGDLKRAASSQIATVDDALAKEEFFENGSALENARQELDRLVTGAVDDLMTEQKTLCEAEIDKWQRSNDWMDLEPDDRDGFVNRASNLGISAPRTLVGLQLLLTNALDVYNGLRDIQANIAISADRRRLERIPAPPPKNGEMPEPSTELIAVPAAFTTVDQIETLVTQLQHLRGRLAAGESIRIVWKHVENDGV